VQFVISIFIDTGRVKLNASMKKTIAPSRWYRLIPVVFITYSLAYLDRANFGFGAAGGMARDLHITQVMSSLLASLFFLGYFFFQIPGVYYATNKSTKRLIFWSLILSPCFIKLIPRITNNFQLHMLFALDARKIAKHIAKNERLYKSY